MRNILFVLLLALLPAAAFAGGCVVNCGGGGSTSIPEPEVLSMLGLGALGFLTTRFIKK